MTPNQLQTCPVEVLTEAMNAAAADDAAGLEAIEGLLGRYPLDPTLHFLHGSILAAVRRYPEAESAMARAVEIAPAYEIARFQLGFLKLTSGDAGSAEEAWEPLSQLAEEHPLRLFAEGLLALARDEFEEAVLRIRRGMLNNKDNLPLNNNMRLLLEKMAEHGGPGEDGGEPVSSAHFLLQQAASKRSMH